MMNARRVIVKNSDRWFSSVHEGKLVNEYIIYTMDGDAKVGAQIMTVTNKGESMALLNTITEYLGDKYDESQITQISFDDFKAQDKEYV